MSLTKLLCLSALFTFSSRAQQPGPQEIVLRYDFNNGTEGWLAGFSDYSLMTGDLQRVAEVRRLPSEVDSSRFGYYLQSMNRSDDIFMFLKRPVGHADGVRPGVTYSVSVGFEFLSSAPSGCFGVGGAPGEAVTLKAGLTLNEPLPLLDGNYVRLNADKGDQITGGRELVAIGDIANGRACEPGERPYVFLHRFVHLPEPVTADNRGTLWIAVGTDSGYEGLTGIYYYSVLVTLRPLTNPPDDKPKG